MSGERYYRIRVEQAGAVVEVEGPSEEFVTTQLDRLISKIVETEPVSKGGTDFERSGRKQTSIQEFAREIGPKSGPDFVVTVGYYLECYQGQAAFTSSDVRDAFIALRYNHKNPSDAIGKAKAAGRIMDSNDKNGFIVTRSGEEWIEERSKQ